MIKASQNVWQLACAGINSRGALEGLRDLGGRVIGGLIAVDLCSIDDVLHSTILGKRANIAYV